MTENTRQPKDRPPPSFQDVVLTTLTEREEQVLDLAAKGMTTNQAAKALNISVRTIHRHRDTLYRKAGARNLIEMLRVFYVFKRKAPLTPKKKGTTPC